MVSRPTGSTVNCVGIGEAMNWRTSPNLWANAFTLESYVTDRWTKQTENVVCFDNVVIAKEYIGPCGSIKKSVKSGSQASKP